jgi:hypothetical protein
LSRLNGLTPDAKQVLGAADELDKFLVQIAVEKGADAEDGGNHPIIQPVSLILSPKMLYQNNHLGIMDYGSCKILCGISQSVLLYHFQISFLYQVYF